MSTGSAQGNVQQKLFNEASIQQMRPQSASHISKNPHQLYLQTLQEARYEERPRPASAAKMGEGSTSSPLKPVANPSPCFEGGGTQFGRQHSLSPKKAEEQLKEEVAALIVLSA